jgi:transposase
LAISEGIFCKLYARVKFLQLVLSIVLSAFETLCIHRGYDKIKILTSKEPTAMNQDQRFRIITEGQRNGVSETCHKYGISRTIYYRWLTRYKENGISGLTNKKAQVIPANKTSKELTDLVLQLVKAYPVYGPRELMYQLKDMGYGLSESAVYNTMRRHHLSTKEQRIRFASKRKPITPDPSVDQNHLREDGCWLIWITPYGKFSNIGQIFEYTIFDYHTHIACSRLYQTLSIECFEDLLSAVALPVAQSLRLETHHYCFIQDLEVPIPRKQHILEGIERVLSKHNLEGHMHVITSSKEFSSAYEKRKRYTQAVLKVLLESLNNVVSLDEIKLLLQQYIRQYNLYQKQSYETGDYTPIEYHVMTNESDLVLPLWAYIDRPYKEEA